jgi:uncharacterized protein (DUF952 family)
MQFEAMDHKGKIYHIVPTAVWSRALQEARYKPASLKAEGFIHCSTFEQILETAKVHFAAHEDLVVVSLIEKHVKDDLKWEPSRDGALFPHLYAEWPWGAVETSRMLVKNAQGEFEWE